MKFDLSKYGYRKFKTCDQWDHWEKIIIYQDILGWITVRVPVDDDYFIIEDPGEMVFCGRLSTKEQLESVLKMCVDDVFAEPTEEQKCEFSPYYFATNYLYIMIDGKPVPFSTNMPRAQFDDEFRKLPELKNPYV